MFQIFLISVFLLSVASAQGQGQGQGYYESGVTGYPGMNCPLTPNGTVAMACQVDCQANHNAIYGFCGVGSDFNCYCTRPLPTLNRISLQCKDRFDFRYDAVCRVDCLCNHGALESRCNFETQACECIGQARDMRLCPFPNRDDMIWYIINQKLPGFPIGWDGRQFILKQ